MKTRLSFTILLLGTLSAIPVFAAEVSTAEQNFLQYCAACHVQSEDEAIPGMDVLTRLSANAILSSMNEGPMRLQSSALNNQQKISLAEYISGQSLASFSQPTQGLCEVALNLSGQDAIHWNGWGGEISNARFRRTEVLINKGNVSRLELKWAFGIPNATQSRSQPAVMGNALFMASQTGMVYAIDARSGCTYWSFQADSGVRTAISISQPDTASARSLAVHFTDSRTQAYALDANTGALIWKTDKLDQHPSAAATGAPAYYEGILYVPLSGVSEESIASSADYACCTFRGSISALDAGDGSVLWKTYLVDEPQPRGASTDGVQLWGPAGVAVWSAPTIDPVRELVYVATGNAYADPPPPTSDAIVALDMHDGQIAWINQMEADVWIMGCSSAGPAEEQSDAAINPNCPQTVGPDFDFNASPILTRLQNGQEILVATRKSGMGYALDPDNNGELLWQYRWGDGSPAGGVWGAAVDEHRAFFAVADQFSPEPGGLRAVNLQDGQELWSMPPQDPLCNTPQGCNGAQSAALTTVPGLVFSGANDGGIRAYDAETGEILWLFNTGVAFETVNGVEARGGSIDGPGAVIANGMVFVTSGNGGFFGTAGNVLLAFGLQAE